MVDCRRGTEGDRRLNAISVSEPYDRTYFAEGCGRPYQRDEYWLSWFGRIADRIVREIGPASVLDAGCAMGMLVEALRDRGVEAFGLDVSDFALSQVRDDIKPYCWRGSITDPLPRRYDLILCVEVLEHLQPDDAERAAANLTQHSDDLLFSSTSEDFKEATHVNVREPEYWVEMFARHDFYRDVDYDAAYLAGWAIRLRRRRDPAARQVANYERLITRLRNENRSLRELAGEHRGRIADQERQLDELRRQLKMLRRLIPAPVRRPLGWLRRQFARPAPATPVVTTPAASAAANDRLDDRAGDRVDDPDVDAAGRRSGAGYSSSS